MGVKKKQRVVIIDYPQYLNSKAWRKKRQEYIDSPHHSNDCASCRKRYSPRGGFNLHHKTYVRLGYEKLSDLVMLCTECHLAIHEYHKENPGASLREATNAVIVSTGMNPGRMQVVTPEILESMIHAKVMSSTRVAKSRIRGDGMPPRKKVVEDSRTVRSTPRKRSRPVSEREPYWGWARRAQP